MTKEEMINAIRVEMSKKSHIRSNYYVYQETLIGDVLKYIDTNCCFVDDGEWHKSRDMKALNHMLHSVFYNFVGKEDRPIDEQDELCIEFVYNLIKK